MAQMEPIAKRIQAYQPRMQELSKSVQTSSPDYQAVTAHAGNAREVQAVVGRCPTHPGAGGARCRALRDRACSEMAGGRRYPATAIPQRMSTTTRLTVQPLRVARVERS